MADDISTFKGFGESGVQALNSGANWAYMMSNMQVARAAAERQKEELELRQREFQTNAGKQIYEMASDASTELGPKVKKQKIEAIKTFAEQAQIPIDPTWIASLDDETYQPKWQELGRSITKSDPEALGNFYQSLFQGLGTKAGLGVLDKGIMQLNSMERFKQSMGLREERFGFDQTKEGQRDFDKLVKPVTFALQGVKRVNHILDKAEQGDLVLNSALASSIASEFARLETQSAATSEGVREKLRIDDLKARWANLQQKLLSKPEDAVSPENVQQLRGMIGTMGESYQTMFDDAVNQAAGGATGIQKKAVIERANATKKSLMTHFPDWKGEGYEGSIESEKPQSKESNAPGEKPPTAVQLDAARKMKIAYEIAKAQDKNAAEVILNKIKSLVPENVRKQVGLP